MTLPVLVLPPDQPGSEELYELTMQEKAALPARFHTPHFLDGKPPLFICRVCWDGEEMTVTAWPCSSALARGWDVMEEKGG